MFKFYYYKRPKSFFMHITLTMWKFGIQLSFARCLYQYGIQLDLNSRTLSLSCWPLMINLFMGK
jgi:hypothetical protein